MTCTLDVVKGSVSTIGSLPNCSWVLYAVDGLPSVMSHHCDRIGFLESCYANCLDCYAPVDATSSTRSLGSNGFLVSDPTPLHPVCKTMSCPSSTRLDDDTVEGLDCSSLTLGEVWESDCAGGCTAARDAGTTMLCVFDPERQSMLLGGSTHLCEFAPCDLSTLMPSSTVSHDCPNTVSEKSCTANCTCGSDEALECDPTLPYPTCEALTCSIGDFLLNCWLSGPGCASWTMGESCAVTCAAEGYQAANETSCTLTCVCDEAVGDVILEFADWSFVRWMTRQQVSVTSVAGATGKEGSQAGGSISTTFAQTVCGYSDTRILSGVGVNSSCKDVSHQRRVHGVWR